MTRKITLKEDGEVESREVAPAEAKPEPPAKSGTAAETGVPPIVFARKVLEGQSPDNDRATCRGRIEYRMEAQGYTDEQVKDALIELGLR